MRFAASNPDREREQGVGLGALFALTVLLVVTLLAWPGREGTLLLVVVSLAAVIVSIARRVGAGVGPHRHELVVIALVAAGIDALLLASASDAARVVAALWLVAVGIGGPIAIFAGLRRRRSIDLAVLFGAISVYLLVGVAFAMGYSMIAIAHEGDLLRTATGSTDGSFQDRVYFSFITLSTTGYGDFTPINRVARALAVVEAIGGQLYLVVALTSVVSALLARRQAGADGRPD